MAPASGFIERHGLWTDDQHRLAKALAAGLETGAASQDMVRAAVAWSAAAVLQPVAGLVDPIDVNRLYGQVLIEEYP